MKKVAGAVLVCASLAFPFLTGVGAADPGVLDAIRRGDTPTLKTRLAAGGDANTRDDSGATALMLATIYGTADDMRALLDARADVNAANAYGATALMWATASTEKTRLLLDRGAAPNARAVDRTTALLTAARRGNVNAMQLLIDRGANPKANASDEANLLRVAYSSELREHPQVRSLLGQHDVKLTDPAAVGTPLLPPNLGDIATLRALLAAGANPRQEMTVATLTLPTLVFAATAGSVEDLKLLLDAGADPNAAGTRGWTPLMFAAASARSSSAVVQALLAAGARLDARDDAGRTAMDWAMLQGDTPMVTQLRAAGARPMAPPPPPPPAVSSPRTAAAAVEGAIRMLQPAGPAFNAQTKCISCHHQSLPAMAVKRASQHGVPIDRTLASHPTDASVAMWKGMREQFLLGNAAIGGFVMNTSYGLVAMAEENAPPNEVTDAVALLLASLQRRDGTWNIPVGNTGGGLRPPLGGSDPIHGTALVARSLEVYAPPGARRDAQMRIARARDYLRTATAFDTQGEVFKLLGLVWTKAGADEIAAQARRLTRLQRSDGGWAQEPSLKSDAYATGQSLFALHEAGVAASAPEYRKGAEYLLRTQLEDGTWFVQSRGFGFQPYFETGFPHGRNQFISSAATSWAAIALANTLPQRN